MAENLNAQELQETQLDAVSGGAGKTVTIKCEKCGKLLNVTYGMNVQCPDLQCRWVTKFSPDRIVKG